MNRFDIVGLTLAEVSLVLLFSFIAIFVPAYSRARKVPDTGALEKQLAAATAENVKLRRELDEASRRNLRSVVAPSCVEVGKATDWLFEAIIRGADDYEILGQQYTLGDLLAKYSSAQAQAKQDRCIHRIRVYYGMGVSVSDYDHALRRIEEDFYSQKLGPEGTK